MEIQNKAKIIFIEELDKYLQTMGEKSIDSTEARALTHKMKGGAGMLQLLDIRQCLTDIQQAIEKGQTYDLHLATLKDLHAKLS